MCALLKFTEIFAPLQYTLYDLFHARM